MKSMTVAAAGLLALALASSSASAQKAEDAIGTWLQPGQRLQRRVLQVR